MDKSSNQQIFSVLDYKDSDEEDEIVSQVYSIPIKEKNKMKKTRKIQKTTKKLSHKKQFHGDQDISSSGQKFESTKIFCYLGKQ